ncbi:MAG: helix-turn-helix transcriptional regulator [Glaciecola sp.]
MDIRGDIVKQMRTERAWTQAHLAEVCDVNLRTIQRVENQGSASVETIMALCVAFDVKRQVLFKVPEAAEVHNAAHPSKRTYALIFTGGILVGALSTIVPLVLMR